MTTERTLENYVALPVADESAVPQRVPDDPYGAFGWFISRCSSGLYSELVEQGKTDAEARNAVIHCFLDMAAGEACRVARREEREPDPAKWRAATDKAFTRAVQRTAKPAESIEERTND